MLSFSLIPSLLIILISVLTFASKFDPFIQQTVGHEADLYANKIQTYIASQFVDMSRFMSDQTVLEALEQGNMHPSLERLLEHIPYHIAMTPEIEALYIEDVDRNILVYSDPLYPARTSHLLAKPVEGMVVSQVMTSPARTSQDVYVMMGLPFSYQKSYLGAMITVINLSQLREIAKDEGMFRSTFRLVVDGEGSVIATNLDGQYWSIQDFDRISDISSHYNEMEEYAGTIDFSLKGKAMVGHYQRIPEIGWTVFTGISNEDVYRPLLETIPLLLFFALLFFVVLLFILHHFSTQITGPIQTLIDGMEHIRRNDVYQRIDLEGNHEFSKIADSFNLLIDQVAREATQLRTLHRELETLTSHIPGGLFTCSVERSMEFLFISDPFVALSGYGDRPSLLQASENRFLTTIHPEDREMVKRIITMSIGEEEKGSFEYRSIGNHTTRWVSCSFNIHGEPPILFGMVMDATAIHDAFTQLKESDERYRILLEQTDEVVFDWSVEEERFLFYSRERNWVRMFGTTLPEDADLTSANLHHMHPDDKVRFSSTIHSLVNEKNRGTRIEVRLTKIDEKGEHYIWTRFLLTSMFDEEGNVVRIAGRIQDIHDDKMESMRLIGLSQTDQLTGLMNRRGFEASVDRILDFADPNAHTHVLIMLDIDDFKVINDTNGHLHGDAMLKMVSNHLRKIFRNTDLLGRLGGDEFAMFLVNFSDLSRLEEKLRLLMHNLHEDGLPVSMGIAVYPQDGNIFTELYQNADQALYSVKHRGKDGYAFLSYRTNLGT
jgi:diguanylate cyclase (GGDEF)-like protein